MMIITVAVTDGIKKGNAIRRYSMAKIYAPPKEVGPVPDLDIGGKTVEDILKPQNEWLKKLKKIIKTRYSNDPLAGEEIAFPVADGHARYMVISTKPVQLVHLPVGDAWEFQYVHRLTAKDVKEQIRRQKALDSLLSSF